MAEKKNALALVASGAAPEVRVKGLKVAKRITTPVHLMKPGDELYARFEGPTAGGEETKDRPGFDKKMTVAPIINLETGEAVTLIVSSVLKSALDRTTGGYVGKSFLILMGPKMPGKRYHQVELFELSAA